MIMWARILLSGTIISLAAACGAGGNDEYSSQPTNEGSGVAADVAVADPSSPSQPEDDPAMDQDRDDRATDRGSSDDPYMRWNFSSSGVGPSLAYGEPRTDNVRLMLRCDGDRVRLHFMRSAEMVASRPGQLTVVSGGKQATSPITTEESELGGMSIRASVARSSGPMTEFSAGEALEVRWGSETIAVPGRSGGPVAQFFKACGG